MKITNLVAVAAVALTASTAWAQSHPTAGAPQATATVNGIFVPAVAGSFGGGSGGVTVNAPPSTPVPNPMPPTYGAIPQSTVNNVLSVIGGDQGAVASFTQGVMSRGGFSQQFASAAANALQLLGSSPTLQSVANATAAWNAAIRAELGPSPSVSKLVSILTNRSLSVALERIESAASRAQDLR
jgi:hypothetical protein